MESTTAFKEFYARHVAPRLKEMHEQRRLANKKYSFKKYGRNVLILFLLLFGLGFSTMFGVEPPVFVMAPLMFTFFFYTIIAPIVIAIKRNKSLSELETKYKTEIVPKILREVFPDLKYNSGSGLNRDECEIQTFIVNQSSSGFVSEDLISGSVNGHGFRMADVTFTYMVRSKRDVSEPITVRGAYAVFKAPVNFSFYLNTYQPHSSLQVLKNIIDPIMNALKEMPEAATIILSQRLQRNMKRESFVNKIKIGHDEFDKIFHVVSDDEKAAKEILTHDLLNKIIEDVKSNNFCFNIAIYGDEIHFAFPYLNMFEFSLGIITTDEKDDRLTSQYINAIFTMVEVYEQIVKNASNINFAKPNANVTTIDTEL
jgi:hypothetical protein